MPRVDRALDYGCGKLRYAVTLAGRARHLVLVDSHTQLTRQQQIDGHRTSVRQYVEQRWQHVKVHDADEFPTSRLRFDFALCANVLSAVPSQAARLRIISAISKHLKRGGQALFVVQYRNSHYRDLEAAKHARRYRDGWLIVNGRVASFYGLISPDELCEHVVRGGLYPTETWTSGGEAAYVLACRQ